MRHIHLIGIGSGNLDHITIQAIKALNDTDVFFVFDKGLEKAELIEIRRSICEQYITDRKHRFVEIESPARDASSGYKFGVDLWHQARADLAAAAIAREMGDTQTGAFLVWGDPALYDSNIRILNLILAHQPEAFTFDVIPGIMSPQVLTAQHKITLNEIGEPVQITTGRKLRESQAADKASVVVMLDDGSGLASTLETDAHIYWGAYLGMADEVLISGPIRDVGQKILDVRKSERARKGWIMDTYLLRYPKSK